MNSKDSFMVHDAVKEMDGVLLKMIDKVHSGISNHLKQNAVGHDDMSRTTLGLGSHPVAHP